MIPSATLHLLDGTPVSVSPHEVLDVLPTPDGCVVTLPGRSICVREHAVEMRLLLARASESSPASSPIVAR